MEEQENKQIVSLSDTKDEYHIVDKETGEIVPVEVRKGYPLDHPEKPLTVETYNVPKFCNSCYLAERCPKFKKDATCYYRIQAQIKGPADIITILTKIMEIQAQRIFFGRFIEEMEGGYIDRTLSEEMERFTQMAKDLKYFIDNRDELELKIKAKGKGSGGILSQLFGLKSEKAPSTVDVEGHMEDDAHE